VIVCLHGFMDSWRTWDLVRPYLGDDVLTPALPGHLGGRRLRGDFDFASDLEADLDVAGIETAHFVGNSLGGYLALQMAMCGRAESLVLLAPAGGADHTVTLEMQERGVLLSEFASRPLPEQAVANLSAAMRACEAAPMIANAREHGWPLDLSRVTCPVRIVWGLEDRLLPYPASAERFRRGLHADWVELDGVGHAPQLEVPLEAAQLILGFM
jgi:pimeloyl-ACP methyl ester carboxylesterase